MEETAWYLCLGFDLKIFWLVIDSLFDSLLKPAQNWLHNINITKVLNHWWSVLESKLEQPAKGVWTIVPFNASLTATFTLRTNLMLFQGQICPTVVYSDKQVHLSPFHFYWCTVELFSVSLSTSTRQVSTELKTVTFGLSLSAVIPSYRFNEIRSHRKVMNLRVNQLSRGKKLHWCLSTTGK